MAADGPVTFARLLKSLRVGASLSQRELAEAAGLSFRTVSDLERGIVTTPQRDTVRLLADALHLIGPARTRFEGIANGRDESARTAATRTLPRDTVLFTGRQQELDQLIGAAASAGGAAGIHAIGGMAGVGKTAFAVHAAHQLAERFPGGQIFLPLHGHTPGYKPVDPEDALASLLLIIGVQPGQIPLGLTERTALWRDRLAARRVLLILDDAASSEQVLPLLPGFSESLVLVTSRRHLSALDDVTTISLDALPANEAAALLVRLTRRPGLNPDDRAVGELVRLCGFLPLAIGMVARQLHHHPAWSLARRAVELASARDRLELMTAENASVAAALDLSYADLDPDVQRLFRRIGLHPCAEFDSYAAAALDGTGLAAASRGLEILYDHYLLAEPAHGRYRVHDLIREHSRVLSGRLDPDQDEAIARLLDYYQAASARADAVVTPYTRPEPAATAPAGAEIPSLEGSETALAWLRTERGSLLACLDYVTEAGEHARVTALTAGLAGLLQLDGPWTDAIDRHTAAVAAAQHAGDRLGEASALVELGFARQLVGEYPPAGEALQQALAIYRDLGSRLGEGNALNRLGSVRELTGEYPAAVQALEEARRIYRDLGDRLGATTCLRRLGTVRRLMGEYPAAIAALEEALRSYRDLGSRLGEAHARNFLGTAREGMGDYRGAISDMQEALVIFRDLGNRLGEANSFYAAGSVRQLAGDYPAAIADLGEALAIYRDIGYRIGEAGALAGLAAACRLTGDLAAAARSIEQSLAIHREISSPAGQAEALNEAGAISLVSGDIPRAERYHQHALELAGTLASPLIKAHALAGLGRCAVAAGDMVRASGLLRRALEIYERLGTADAPVIRAELEAIAG